MRARRRQLLLGLGGLAAGGCAAPKDAADTSCGVTGAGPGLPYCLVKPVRLTFSGARALSVGEVELRGLDDSSAAILMLDERGFFALSATCPHQCCTVTLCQNSACTKTTPTPNDCSPPLRASLGSGAAFFCPCHGSEFAADGSVLRGPASSGLPAVKVEISDGDAIVDLSVSVPSATRVG